MVLCAAIAGGIAFFVNEQQTPVYESSTTLLVNAPVGGSAQLSDTGLDLTERLLGTYAELLVKQPVLDQVIQNLDLNTSPGSIAGRVKVSVMPNTLLLTITVEDTNPQRAADIANEMVRVLNQNERDLLDNPFVAYRNALHVIEFAQPRLKPIRPQTTQNAALAAFAGAVLAVGIALLIEYLDETVKTSEDIRRLTGLPTLASIASIKGSEPSAKLITASDPRSPISEAYRMFLAHIEFSHVDHTVHSILVTSGEPGEGKSTNAANLAVALAQTGKRVLLVDMDLRRPTLHKFFRHPNTFGVTTALQRQDGEDLSGHIIETSIENLALMPSGPLPINPARLFGSRQMVDLIEELKSQGDIVLFDSPAALMAVDAILLARACDSVLMVVQAGSTRADVVTRTRDLISQSSVYILGVMLNNVPRSRSGAYYYDDEGQRKRRIGWWRRLRLVLSRRGKAEEFGIAANVIDTHNK